MTSDELVLARYAARIRTLAWIVYGVPAELPPEVIASEPAGTMIDLWCRLLSSHKAHDFQPSRNPGHAEMLIRDMDFVLAIEYDENEFKVGDCEKPIVTAPTLPLAITRLYLLTVAKNNAQKTTELQTASTTPPVDA